MAQFTRSTTLSFWFMHLLLSEAIIAVTVSVNETNNYFDLFPYTPEHFEQVGVIHNKAFTVLTDKYSVQRPKDRTEAMKDVCDIISQFCEDTDDRTCCSYQDRGFHRDVWERPNIAADAVLAYPEHFDPKLVVFVDEMFSVLRTATSTDGFNATTSLEDILDRLTAVKTNMKDHFIDVNEFGELNYRTNPVHLMTVLTGVSVAIESTKLWMNVYSNSSHPLHNLHHSSFYDGVHRKSQNTRRRRARNQSGSGRNSADLYDDETEWPFKTVNSARDEAFSECFGDHLNNHDRIFESDDDHFHFEDDDRHVHYSDVEDDHVHFDDDDQHIHFNDDTSGNLFNLLADLIRLKFKIKFCLLGEFIIPFFAGVVCIAFRAVIADVLGVFKGIFELGFTTPVQMTNIGAIFNAALRGAISSSAAHLADPECI